MQGKTASHESVAQPPEGMEVMSADGLTLGKIRGIRQDDFLLDRLMARDLSGPTGAIQKVQGNLVMLNVDANQIDNQGWGGA